MAGPELLPRSQGGGEGSPPTIAPLPSWVLQRLSSWSAESPTQTIYLPPLDPGAYCRRGQAGSWPLQSSRQHGLPRDQHCWWGDDVVGLVHQPLQHLQDLPQASVKAVSPSDPHHTPGFARLCCILEASPGSGSVWAQPRGSLLATHAGVLSFPLDLAPGLPCSGCVSVYREPASLLLVPSRGRAGLPPDPDSQPPGAHPALPCLREGLPLNPVLQTRAQQLLLSFPCELPQGQAQGPGLSPALGPGEPTSLSGCASSPPAVVGCGHW